MLTQAFTKEVALPGAWLGFAEVQNQPPTPPMAVRMGGGWGSGGEEKICHKRLGKPLCKGKKPMEMCVGEGWDGSVLGHEGMEG